MSKVTDLNSARGRSSFGSPNPEAGADLANMLAAFSTKIFESCAAIRQDGCNTYVTVAEGNILQNASLELARLAKRCKEYEDAWSRSQDKINDQAKEINGLREFMGRQP